MASDPVSPTPRQRSQLRRWLCNALLAILGLVILVAAAGASYQAIANYRDGKRFPRAGQLLDIGGYRLNLNCTGSGTPAVILDSGLGVPAVGWALVQPEVAKFTRVCSYDRAGYGWSDPGPLPRTSLQIVRELHTLLQDAGVQGPYVLVGHSFGGYNVRVYNCQYPGEVAGIILVDSSHEDQLNRLPAELKQRAAKQLEWQKRLRFLEPTLYHLGISRLLAQLAFREETGPKDLKEEVVYLTVAPKADDAAIAEQASFEESAEQVRASGSLQDKLLIVLTAGALPPGNVVGNRKEAEEFHHVWVCELQPQLARLSTRGKQIVVTNSSHMIPWEQPTAIVDAIREVVEAARVKPSEEKP